MHYTGRVENGTLLDNITGHKPDISSFIPALVHGRKNEPKARNIYIQTFEKSHLEFNCADSGLIIDSELQVIAASPDGLVECKCCSKGCIEIKCPFKYASESAKNAASMDTKNFQIVNGIPVLKK